MSKRLQVLFDEAEYRDLQRIARRRRMTVSEWVRQAVRAVRRQEPSVGTERKLAALRAGLRHQFPTADIEQMLGEIEQGYTDRHAS